MLSAIVSILVFIVFVVTIGYSLLFFVRKLMCLLEGNKRSDETKD